jgi:pimeloyl-ACP methyl ester carboxylesterase
MQTFSWLPARITAGRRIIRLDLRGHGGSDVAPGSYTLDRYGSDVVATLRSLTREPAVFVGHSLGGSIGWWAAQNHPKLLRAVFLEDPALYLGEPAEHEANFRPPLLEDIRDAARVWQEAGASPDAVAEQMAVELVDPQSEEGPTWGEIMAHDDILAEARATLEMDPEVVTAMANRTTLAETDVRAPITVPLSILAADVTTAFSDDHQRRLARTHPEIHVSRVAGARHGIHAEIPYRPIFTSELAAFLDRYAPPRTY